MKKLRPMLIIIIAFVTLLTLPGCWSAKGLSSLAIVTGIGIDKGASLDQLLLTIQIVKPSQAQVPSSEGGKSRGKAFWNATCAGETMIGAIREVTHLIGKEPFLAHSNVIIFGNDFATTGVKKTLDFFLRNPETQPTALILVASGRAGDILNVESEAEILPVQNIIKIIKGAAAISQFKVITINDFANNLMSKTTAPIAPLVSITQNGNRQNIYVSGLAVFKKDKLVGALNDMETRGLLWTTGDVKKGLILITSPEDTGNVAFEISKSKSKVTPEIKAGRVIIHIEVRTETNLVEQTSADKIYFPVVALLEERQAEVIRQEIMAAFDKSAELSADIFGFGDIVYKRFPAQWQSLEDHWDEVYPRIDLVLDIKVTMRETGLVTQPVSPEK